MKRIKQTCFVMPILFDSENGSNERVVNINENTSITTTVHFGVHGVCPMCTIPACINSEYLLGSVWFIMTYMIRKTQGG